MGKGKSSGREALVLSEDQQLKLTDKQRREAFSRGYFNFDNFRLRACGNSLTKAEKFADLLVKEGFLQKTETITYTHTKTKIKEERYLSYRYTPQGSQAYKDQLVDSYMKEFEPLPLEAKDIIHFLYQGSIAQPNQFDIAKGIGLPRKLVSKAATKLIDQDFIRKHQGVSSTSYYYGNGTPTYYYLSSKGEIVAAKLKKEASSIWQSVAG